MSNKSAMKTIKAFIRSNKNHTQKALAISLLAIEHMLEHRDWDGCAVMIKETDSKMGAQIRAIINATVGGISISKDDKHHTGMRFKLGDNFAGTEKLAVLQELVAKGATLYSHDVQQGLLEKETKAPEPKTLEDATKHVESYLSKHGFVIQGKIVQDTSASTTGSAKAKGLAA